MFRLFGFVLVVVSIFGLSYQFINAQVPEWKRSTVELLVQAEAAGLEADAWQMVAKKARQKLPPVYPFSRVQSLLEEAADLVFLTEQFKKEFSLNFSLEGKTIDPNDLRQFFALLGQTDESLKKIIADLRALPAWAMDEENRRLYDTRLAWLEQLQVKVQDAQTFESVFNGFLKKEERVLLLLQNQNEPRSTGGFAGSLVLFNFAEKQITWEFLDIYALDRLVPEEVQKAAPEWFYGLSKTISMRDANFWPDFSVSAQEYQRLFKAAGQAEPSTVVAINLNVIKELLAVVPPVKLKKWNFELNQYNFDVVLQFLVEAKVTGRYNVKAPVEIFARELFSAQSLKGLTPETLMGFEIKKFIKHKNILAYSSHKELQGLFAKWQLAGDFKVKKEADNYLHFDFVSVGANKSEKFMWTKLNHDSLIRADGTVVNTLKIKRTHALGAGEIKDLLGTNNLSQNVRDLITPELLWKLGAGENRTVLRVWVPREAVLLKAQSPSGTISWQEDKTLGKFYYEIPLNVSPGETLNTAIRYQTRISRGSVGWRPYYLELLGTPGRDKTELITTISVEEGGRFSAVTQNLGRPVELLDQDFRTVVEFEPVE